MGVDCATPMPAGDEISLVTNIAANNVAQDNRLSSNTFLTNNPVVYIAVFTTVSVIGVAIIACVVIELYRRKTKRAEQRIFRAASQIYTLQQASSLPTLSIIKRPEENHQSELHVEVQTQ
jgi:hypothetical protein